MRFLFIFAVACSSGSVAPAMPAGPVGTSSPTTSAKLTASDITTIWPMPTEEAQIDTLLAATSTGRYGELLPASLYQLPILDERDGNRDPQQDRVRLRAVAIRFEPCRSSFGSPQDPSCTNQLRLVLQILRKGGGGAKEAIGANDGAVLVFYKLTRDDLLAFARDVIALRATSGAASDDALGVHPVLAREGAGGAYAKALQAKILEHIGAERLTKITFFTRTLAREPVWVFGSFEVHDGKAIAKKLPTLEVEKQSLEGASLRKVITPMTSAADNPDMLLSIWKAHEPSPAERGAFAAVLRIQNPTKHNADTMACAECHVAQRTQATAEQLLGLRVTDFADDHFTSTVKSANEKIENENFHATSYLGTNLIVSTRVANETSAVLAALSSLLGP